MHDVYIYYVLQFHSVGTSLITLQFTAYKIYHCLFLKASAIVGALEGADTLAVALGVIAS